MTEHELIPVKGDEEDHLLKYSEATVVTFCE